MGPIPWKRIGEYAESKGLDPLMTRIFERVIRNMDESYLSLHINKRQRKEAQAAQAAHGERRELRDSDHG